jgi:hypothetical protein
MLCTSQAPHDKLSQEMQKLRNRELDRRGESFETKRSDMHGRGPGDWVGLMGIDGREKRDSRDDVGEDTRERRSIDDL